MEKSQKKVAAEEGVLYIIKYIRILIFKKDDAAFSVNHKKEKLHFKVGCGDSSRTSAFVVHLKEEAPRHHK